MAQQNVLEKIKKLLSLATSDNENEARLAMSKAQKLMAENNIHSVSMEEEDKVISQQIEENTVGLSPYRRELATCLANHFRVRVLLNRTHRAGDSITRILVVGRPEEVKIFEEVFNYTYRVFEMCFAKYLKSEKSNGNLTLILGVTKLSRADSIKVKNTYFQGFISGMIKQLKHNEEEFALVCIAPKSVVKKADNLATGTVKHNPRAMAQVGKAYFAGYQDGKASQSKEKQVEA